MIDAAMTHATMGCTFEVPHNGIPIYIFNDSRVVDDDPEHPFYMESWCAEFELPIEGQPGTTIMRCCNQKLSGLCADFCRMVARPLA